MNQHLPAGFSTWVCLCLQGRALPGGHGLQLKIIIIRPQCIILSHAVACNQHNCILKVTNFSSALGLLCNNGIVMIKFPT